MILEKLTKEEFEKQVEEEKKEFEVYLQDLELQERVEKELEYESGIPLFNKYMDLFRTRSYCNEVPGEILFRILLNCLLKDKAVFKSNGKRLKFLMHFFFIQDSGSGKDQAVDFFVDLIKMINKVKPNTISFAELTGAESPESMLDDFGTKLERGKEKYDYGKIIPGTLSKHDLLISRECSYLFVEKRGMRQTRSEYLLLGLEQKLITKRLKSWEGHSTFTQPNFAFIGCSRPIGGMKKHIVSSGLQQRALNYCREVSPELRRKMARIDAANSFGVRSDGAVYKKNMEYLARKFLLLRVFATDAEFIVPKPVQEKMNTMIRDAVLDWYDYVDKEIKMDEQKGILNTFIARFTDVAIILSYQNALIRQFNSNLTNFKDVILTEDDVSEALKLLNRSFDALRDWVEETIEIDKSKLKKVKDTKQAIKESFVIYQKEELLKGEIAEYVAQRTNVSKSYAARKIREHVGAGKLLREKTSKRVALNI